METWDDDALEYGYIVCRVAGDGWWHLHFGRAAVEYECALLGRRTDVIACVQRFARGAALRSGPHLLTLDGNRAERDACGDGRVDYSWGLDFGDQELIAEAQHFQREIMPLLYDSERFQRAVAGIVKGERSG